MILSNQRDKRFSYPTRRNLLAALNPTSPEENDGVFENHPSFANLSNMERTRSLRRIESDATDVMGNLSRFSEPIDTEKFWDSVPQTKLEYNCIIERIQFSELNKLKHSEEQHRRKKIPTVSELEKSIGRNGGEPISVRSNVLLARDNNKSFSIVVEKGFSEDISLIPLSVRSFSS